MAVVKLNIPEQGKVRCLVELVNIFFHLTKSEIEILIAFMELDREVACSREARKLIAAKEGTSAAVINNHVKALKDKKAIIRDGKGYRYHPVLCIQPQETEIKFVIQTIDGTRDTQGTGEGV